MVPLAMVGGSAEDKRTQAVSNDEVEEIQGAPMMVANTSMYGASVGTTGPTMRRLLTVFKYQI